MGVNKKFEKKLEKFLNWKILHVKDTDRSNQAGSEIDPKSIRSQNFRHFWAFPTIRPYFNGLVLFFPHQMEPPAHHGRVLKKKLSQKNSFQNDCISPTYGSYDMSHIVWLAWLRLQSSSILFVLSILAVQWRIYWPYNMAHESYKVRECKKLERIYLRWKKS